MRWLVIVLAVAVYACSGIKTTAGSLVQFRTTVGDMDVELFDQDKPVTVKNFLDYVNAGYYTNMIFHRWVPAFVVQGGGIYTAGRHTANPKLDYLPTFGPITNEFNVGKFYSNLYGTLAMAKVGGDPNSATSQWFFNLGDNSANLDSQNGGFTVFGRVVKGTNILNKFLNRTSGVLLYTNLSFPNELPVIKNPPGFEDLVYVDISILNVKVIKTNSVSQISWNSVTGQTNLVEYTTSIPAVWQTLVTTNGNGASYLVKDTNPANPARFYRVRVVY
ncbi:MAG: GlyGly-CTERM sorting protein [Verrucomicrobiales bacterium]|nr:GlyGly-CTERM sorting protein [Verrucomicrobiales bacterium]